MTESQKMLQILHENQKKVRREANNRKKDSKLDTILSYTILFAGSTIFLLGIMSLIAVIENLPF